MKETIYTIPINESFEVQDGACPVCRLHDKLIEDTLEYVLGASMMEPDVRQRTNTQGFCGEHLTLLMGKQKRLPLSLILETHVKELRKKEKLLFTQPPCYVCQRTDGFLQSYYSNIQHLWRTEEDFRKLWKGQDYICRPHLIGLYETAGKNLPRKEAAEFQKSLIGKAEGILAALTESLEIFTKSFDHRFAGQDLGEHKEAVQRSHAFLTGRKGKG